MTDQIDSDIVIIGAGLAGTSTALLLAPLIDQGCSITLIEQHTLAIKDASSLPSFDGRATALSYGSRSILESIGVWQGLNPNSCPIHHIEVSDQGHFGQAHLHADEQNVDALGYIAPNFYLGRTLVDVLLNHTNIRVQEKTEVIAIEHLENKASLSLSNGETLSCRLLILADGGRSPIFQGLGIYQTKRSYGAHAIVTQVTTDQPHANWAYERFSEFGPIAFLPLNQRDYAVVWTVSDDDLSPVMDYGDNDFITELQKRIGYRVGCITTVGARASYPLSRITATEQIRPNIVLVGNAAHSLHPVAGQGFNLTLRDAARLAEHIQQAYSDGYDIGSLTVLQAYRDAQRRDQQITIAASDWLPRIFNQKGKWLQRSRDIGLLALSAAPTARRLFTRQAMGMGSPAARHLAPDKTSRGTDSSATKGSLL